MNYFFDVNENKSKVEFKPTELNVQLGSTSNFWIRSDPPLVSPVNLTFYARDSLPPNTFTLNKPIVELLPNDTSWHAVALTSHRIASEVDIAANCSQEACQDILNLEAFLRLTIVHSLPLSVIINVVGWIYFVAWSISFYPQIILNFKRKSVVGLNFDFLLLNFIGFLCYALFNSALYWIPAVRTQYFKRYPKKLDSVLLNDVVFALHALFACAITAVQCFCYQRGNQKISFSAFGITLVDVGIALISLVLTIFTPVLELLDFFYILSYVKLSITLIKYVPQAVFNYRRQSTVGWSIGNILLDFTGGTMSLLQMLLIAYNNDNFQEFFGNPTKFGLGAISLVFDVIFIFQHYVLYRNSPPNGDYDTFVDPAESPDREISSAHPAEESHG